MMRIEALMLRLVLSLAEHEEPLPDRAVPAETAGIERPEEKSLPAAVVSRVSEERERVGVELPIGLHSRIQRPADMRIREVPGAFPLAMVQQAEDIKEPRIVVSPPRGYR